MCQSLEEEQKGSGATGSRAQARFCGTFRLLGALGKDAILYVVFTLWVGYGK